MQRRRPQIAILVANLPAERDRRVIRECLSLERAGFDVTVIAPRGNRSLTVLPGSRGTRLRPYPAYWSNGGVLSFVFEFAWSLLCIGGRVVAEVLAGRAHAVQVCNPPDVFWPLALLLRILGRPWVFDHHDLCPEVYATRSGSPNGLIFRALVLMEWLTLRTASAVVATNESYRENALHRGVAPEKICVVRNGPAVTEIAAPAGADDPDGPFTLVYLGVLGPQDNVEGAVLAAAELTELRGRTDWRMVIAGDGDTYPALTKLAADRGLGDVVRFTGWLEAKDVDDLLRQATIAIQPDLPTRMNQLSTMAKSVEYLGRGLPVVAADLIETRRTAADAAVYVPNGTPTEFAHAINDLLDDPEARRRMREVGLRRFTDILSWETQATTYVALWQRLLAKRLRTRPAATPATERPDDFVETTTMTGADQT